MRTALETALEVETLEKQLKPIVLCLLLDQFQPRASSAVGIIKLGEDQDVMHWDRDDGAPDHHPVQLMQYKTNLNITLRLCCTKEALRGIISRFSIICPYCSYVHREVDLRLYSGKRAIKVCIYCIGCCEEFRILPFYE